jgi:dimethylargininase
MLTAILRAVPDSLARCELTHLSRVPIDVVRAAEQHRQYEGALRALGCTVRHLPAAHELADSVFVEDVAIVLDEIAIITRPGAVSRRPEREAVAVVLSDYRPLHVIDAPGTLDGGDVLRLDRRLYVGLSTRTNEDGARQLARLSAPFGYTVECVETAACLHLKSAVTALGPRRVLCNPLWMDARTFQGVEVVEVHPDEPSAANVLRIRDTIVSAAAHARTVADLRERGYRVCTVDVSELAKAEAGVTCCSLIVDSSQLPALTLSRENGASGKLAAGSWKLE